MFPIAYTKQLTESETQESLKLMRQLFQKLRETPMELPPLEKVSGQLWGLLEALPTDSQRTRNGTDL